MRNSTRGRWVEIAIAVGLAGLPVPAFSEDARPEGIPWNADPDAAVQLATASGRPILYDFGHPW